MDTLSLSLSGTSSVLEAQYFPPIELSSNKNYVLGLVEFLTFNSIPNVNQNNNQFKLVGSDEIIIPIGSYEIDDIEKYLQKVLTKQKVSFHLKANNNTLRCEMKCDRAIDFEASNSIGRVLGFSPKILAANVLHKSDIPISIIKINSIRVECNITTGAYINSEKVHTIYQFFPVVSPGYKIVQVPSEIIYLPVAVNSIDHLQLRIVDQDGNPIDFRGEVITVRLHIKTVA